MCGRIEQAKLGRGKFHLAPNHKTQIPRMNTDCYSSVKIGGIRVEMVAPNAFSASSCRLPAPSRFPFLHSFSKRTHAVYLVTIGTLSTSSFARSRCLEAWSMSRPTALPFFVDVQHDAFLNLARVRAGAVGQLDVEAVGLWKYSIFMA